MPPEVNPQQQGQAAAPPSIVAAIFEAMDKHLIGPAGDILDATFLHGPVAAALRQGADEIGMALKAFPDAIQTHEPGSVLNPLFSDIANNRRPDAHGHSPMDAGQSAATSVGHAPEIPSVAAILDNPQAYLSPDQQSGQQNSQNHGMSM